MFLPDSRPAVALPRFSRHLSSSEGDGEGGEVCVRLGLYTQVRGAEAWAWGGARVALSSTSFLPPNSFLSVASGGLPPTPPPGTSLLSLC